MNIKKASEKLPRMPTMDVCTYKHLKIEFAKYIILPPIKLYNILGCEDELAARSGSGLLIFSAAAGTGVVFLSPRRSEGGLAPGSGAGYPSGGGGAWT